MSSISAFTFTVNRVIEGPLFQDVTFYDHSKNYRTRKFHLRVRFFDDDMDVWGVKELIAPLNLGPIALPRKMVKALYRAYQKRLVDISEYSSFPATVPPRRP